jgi:predicted DCC family thiol-disulfide oxidoreductase YuxK
VSRQLPLQRSRCLGDKHRRDHKQFRVPEDIRWPVNDPVASADRPPIRRGDRESNASWRRLLPRQVGPHTDGAHTGERPSGLLSDRPWAILYDAECGFCIWLLSALLRWDGAARLHPIALQRPEADELLQPLTSAERMASWHLISPSGERRSGGAGVPPLLRLLPAGRFPAAAFARVPGLTDHGYRWVARHRCQLSKCVPSRAKRRARRHVHQREREPLDALPSPDTVAARSA